MSYLVTDRTVWTWEPDGWPAGVITGIPNGKGGFRIEHVISFDPSVKALLRLVMDGLEVAWKDYQYVTFHCPKAFHRSRQLARLAERLGFTRYAEDHVCDHYVLRCP